MIAKTRVAATSLAVSASLLVALAVHEGYSDKAYIPIPGDVPTIGFGETAGVKMGQTTTPVRALVQLLNSADKHAKGMVECIKVPISQNEFDAYLSFTYNVGVGAFCRSTLARKLNAQDYEGACNELLRWDRAGGRVVAGLTKRRKEEHALCLGNSTSN